MAADGATGVGGEPDPETGDVDAVTQRDHARVDRDHAGRNRPAGGGGATQRVAGDDEAAEVAAGGAAGRGRRATALDLVEPGRLGPPALGAEVDLDGLGPGQ